MFELARSPQRRAVGTFDQLFDEFFGGWRPTAPAGPALNWLETPADYRFEVAVPGVEKSDLSIEAVQGRLTIAGQRRTRSSEQESRQFTGERLQGRFSRSVRLPDNADVGEVTAELTNGILTVSIAKTAEAKPRRIEIQ